MYIYDQVDQRIVDERVAQFRDQTRRFLAGELGEDEFLALRLMNGVYVQRHAPMLRVAIPYGLMAAKQMRQLAHIARRYDRGYGHFTTRQNIQFNWPKIEDIPDILAELAEVQMHAIQTSGNCIRNTTTDPLAGIAADELEDPRPYCEIIRQWSTLHPEFAYLPRKFKIAVTGASKDRAATLVHDIGLRIVRNDAGESGFEVSVGGGLGRTPILAKTLCRFLEKQHLLSYLEAIVRVYNLHGRRDNKYKARIKILVNAMGVEAFRTRVDEEWHKIKDKLRLDEAEIERVKAFFRPLDYDTGVTSNLDQQSAAAPDFGRWLQYNTAAHKVEGYRAVFISLKPTGVAPGDISADQMDQVAELADRYSFGLIRSTHDQNLLLADVKESDLYALWQQLAAANLAAPNIGTIADMICCPGLDFCALANASSIDIAKEIQSRFEDLDYLYDLGEIKLKMSGCMNGCAHHDIGHIGILGVDKRGVEWYQFTLGGYAETEAKLGKRLGRAIAKDRVADTVETLVQVYLEQRHEGERFVDTYERIGIESFKERVYDTAN
ncbi:MAG TPA: nitrite/sulfite reductase [Candidatus Tenderia sp.]|nr:nitrite/sulfite reductase [Candidatus Tenderia sp.]